MNNSYIDFHKRKKENCLVEKKSRNPMAENYANFYQNFLMPVKNKLYNFPEYGQTLAQHSAIHSQYMSSSLMLK